MQSWFRQHSGGRAGWNQRHGLFLWQRVHRAGQRVHDEQTDETSENEIPEVPPGHGALESNSFGFEAILGELHLICPPDEIGFARPERYHRRRGAFIKGDTLFIGNGNVSPGRIAAEVYFFASAGDDRRAGGGPREKESQSNGERRMSFHGLVG